MEEILASIRRIIESNDPVSGETFASDTDDMDEDMSAPVARQADVDFSYESVEFAPANDPGPATPAVQAPQRMEAPAQPEAPRSVSLADLAARVRLASERTERPLQQPVQQTVLTTAPAPAVNAPSAPTASATPELAPRGESPLMTTRLAELRAPQLRPSISIEVQPAQTVVVRPTPAPAPAPQAAPLAEPVAVQAAPQVQAPAQAAVSEPERREIPEVRVEMRREEPRAPSFDAIAMHLAAGPQSEERVEEEVRPSAGTDLTAIISAATVEHVSRSFSDLAAAIDGQQRRSLDEMAEEMLRPMLKDWLDDNLPTLVERLVREEIERVARGPRR
jgi:cell pole-organizing protein PopZ